MKAQIIQINKSTKDKIDAIEGSTVDRKINKIIDLVEPIMPFNDYNDKASSIKLYPDTLERIDMLKISKSESRDNVLLRLLFAFEEFNNTSTVEEWVSFKLTNPYNDLLVIDGQLEYNSGELSFNYRGNVFRQKLPPNYIVEGKDLTKELYKWYDNLDWNRIRNLLLENVDNQTVIDERDFILEVNDVFKSEV